MLNVRVYSSLLSPSSSINLEEVEEGEKKGEIKEQKVSTIIERAVFDRLQWISWTDISRMLRRRIEQIRGYRSRHFFAQANKNSTTTQAEISTPII